MFDNYLILPTPLQKMEALSVIRNPLTIFIKRDDLIGRFLGGNKVRMLYALLNKI